MISSSAMVRLWKTMGSPARSTLIIGALLAGLAGAASVLLLGLSGWFIAASAVAGGAGLGFTFNHLVPAAGVRGAALSRVAAKYAEQIVGHEAILSLSAALRPQLFRALARGQSGLAAVPASAMSLLSADIDAVEGGYLRCVLPFVGTITGALVSVWFATLIGPWALFVLVFGFVGSCWLVPQLTRPWQVRMAAEAAHLDQAAKTSLGAVLDGLDELAQWQRLDSALGQVATAQDALSQKRARIEIISRSLGLVPGLFAVIAVLALMVIGHAAGASLPICLGASFSGLAAFQAGQMFVGALHALPEAEGAATRLQARFDAAPRVAEPDEFEAPQVTKVLPIAWQNLSVSPGEAGPEHRISVHDGSVVAGEVTFLMAPSGAGKTTLIETFLRLRDPAVGTLTFAAQPHHSLRAAAIRTLVACAPQSPQFLSGTVREALALAAPNADDDAMIEALRVAVLDQLVRSRPEGLSAPLTEASRTFSGGELRRLGIARALLGNPDLLILDEPFAGLDPKTSHQLGENLATWLQQEPDRRAILVSCHQAPEPNGPLAASARIVPLSGSNGLSTAGRFPLKTR